MLARSGEGGVPLWESGPADGGGGAEPTDLVRAATGEEPGAALDAIKVLRPLIDTWERRQVDRARSIGWNWADIARRLGRHRQAVHREYGPRKPKGTGPDAGAPGPPGAPG